MEIVIKISKNDYEKIKDGHVPFKMLEVLQNGVPLPKGHDRLIEAREVINAMFAGKTIDDVPTVIEAESEVQDADSD